MGGSPGIRSVDLSHTVCRCPGSYFSFVTYFCWFKSDHFSQIIQISSLALFCVNMLILTFYSCLQNYMLRRKENRAHLHVPLIT